LKRWKEGKQQGWAATDFSSDDEGGVNGLLTQVSGATAASLDNNGQLPAGSATDGLRPNICIRLFIFSDSVKSSDAEPAIE
jgi:hypothetical protein